jgi:hypothetical protein
MEMARRELEATGQAPPTLPKGQENLIAPPQEGFGLETEATQPLAEGGLYE